MISDLKAPLAELVRDLEKQVPYAAALYKKRSGTHINVNRMQETVEPEDPMEGLVFTLWNGQAFFEYSTNQWTWAGLKSTLNGMAKRANAEVLSGRPKADIDPGPSTQKDFTGPCIDQPSSVPTTAKLEQARERLRQTLSMDPAVVNAFSIQGDTLEENLFVNRNKIISQKIARVEVILAVFVSDGKNTTQVHHGRSKQGGYELVQISEHEIREIVEDGKILLKAERLPPGTYEVLTDPEWSGIIAHECFGHGMETDLYVRERALSQRFIGKPVASPIVNMFDDPSLIEEAGGFFFDDEGQLSRPTHIIQNGVLKRGLTDLASAHKLKLERSANGRRESFARKAYARMTNTFFENGTSSKEEMISSIQNGLYLRHATNGMEDPQAWGIQVEGLWAEEIKNGKRTGKVFSPIIMTGFVPDLLMSISMVGNDRTISGLGMCGKGHKEWVKNTTGGPHLRMTARLA